MACPAGASYDGGVRAWPGPSAAGPEGSAGAVPAAAAGDGPEPMDEDALLQQALAMSMQVGFGRVSPNQAERSGGGSIYLMMECADGPCSQGLLLKQALTMSRLRSPGIGRSAGGSCLRLRAQV